MQSSAFIAKCPYEIGEQFIQIHKSASVGKTDQYWDYEKGIPKPLGKTRTITDIITIHSVAHGKVNFLYEFDGSGTYENLKGNEVRGEKLW